MTFTLKFMADRYSICRLDPGEPVPEWAKGDFFSITRTPEELSVVCPEAAVPNEVKCEPGWRCLQVVGKFDFSVVGMIASLTRPLAEAGISVSVISTFDTDYLLVKETDLELAVKALEAAGHRVDSAIHSACTSPSHDRK